MNNVIQLKLRVCKALIAVGLTMACFGLASLSQAVSPAPDGCYPGFTTAEGCSALNFLTTGAGNTGVGWYSLFLNTTASYNTGVGAGTLVLNTGDSNTAVGAAAMLLNTTGTRNVAVGTDALVHNDSGSVNTATGADALFSNTTGADNTATAGQALANNTTGNGNTADGISALNHNTTGNNNVALGTLAGILQTTGSNNVYIGFNMQGTAGESDACYIRSIFGQTSASGIPVLINSDNKLGTMTSSKRFKEQIKPMDRASEAVLALRPVTFRYKKEIDPTGTSQFGLVAEDVEKVNPDLVVRDKEGKAYSVRYDQVNAMLLNEFLKEHRKVQEDEATISEVKATVAQQQNDFRATVAQLTARLDDQAAQIQKVSVQIETSKPAARAVVNNP